MCVTVKDVRQEEIHTAEPLVPEPSAFEVELAIEKLKNHTSPGIDQIPAGGRTIRCAIHKLIISIWNKEELPEEWKGSIIVPIHKKGEPGWLETKCYTPAAGLRR